MIELMLYTKIFLLREVGFSCSTDPCTCTDTPPLRHVYHVFYLVAPRCVACGSLVRNVMHQSELWPWTNLATEKELSGAEQTAIGVEGLHTVEVRWSGLSFADTWRRADRESSVVRLKIGLQADGIVLSAFGFA